MFLKSFQGNLTHIKQGNAKRRKLWNFNVYETIYSDTIWGNTMDLDLLFPHHSLFQFDHSICLDS